MKAKEAEFLEIARQLIHKHRSALAGQGLTIDHPELEVWDSFEKTYRSELRIKIYKRGILHDSLEFVVFENGNCLLSRREVEDWLDEQLRTLSYTE